jgi:hypothetical protein
MTVLWRPILKRHLSEGGPGLRATRVRESHHLARKFCNSLDRLIERAITDFVATSCFLRVRQEGGGTQFPLESQIYPAAQHLPLQHTAQHAPLQHTWPG